MRKLAYIPLTLLAIMLTIVPAHAHIIGLGWTFENNGDVTFDALHWHSSRTAAMNNGALIIDGFSYAFNSVTNNTTSMTGLDGALTNPSYSAYNGAGTLSAISSYDDWLHVTVAGLTAGIHSITAAYGPGGLTSWTLANNVQTFQLTTPDPVPEPGTLLLLGAGILGLVLYRHRSKTQTS